jgi:hypothetical protein
MTDSELKLRMDDAFGQIGEALEERGARLELVKNPDFQWAGVVRRLPAGRLLINTHKTGKKAAPDSTKAVAEAVADLTLEGRLLGRVLFYDALTEVELPGGTRKPIGRVGIDRMFTSL